MPCLSCHAPVGYGGWPSSSCMVWNGNLPHVSSCFEQAKRYPMSLHAFNRLNVTLCIFMLWTGCNLSCASSCFKAETRHVSLHAFNGLKLVLYVPHALNRLKVGLCLIMPWTGWQSPYRSLHALNRMKSDLCLLMLQSWNLSWLCLFMP